MTPEGLDIGSSIVLDLNKYKTCNASLNSYMKSPRQVEPYEIIAI